MLRDKYSLDLEKIYDALPKNMRGRWQVGNSSLEAQGTQMSKANHLTNRLLDKIFENELHDEYKEFQKLAHRFDEFNVEDQGILRKGQQLFSEKRDADLRKRLANGLYRQFNAANTIDVSSLDEMLDRVKQHHKLVNSDVAGLKRNDEMATDNKYQPITRSTEYQRIPRFETISRSFTKISRVFQMDVRSEVNAERKFLRNQEREQQQTMIEESYGPRI